MSWMPSLSVEHTLTNPWQISRWTEENKAFDEMQNLSMVFLQMFMMTWIPSIWDWLLNSKLGKMSKKAYPDQPKKWNLDPAPTVSITPPLIATAVYPFLESGFAEPVSAVQKISGPRSVQLADGRVLNEVDTIIYCTGYESAVPFAPKEYNPYPIADEAPALYRNIFPLHHDPAVRNSLAFIGQGGIPFPGFVQFELQIWSVSQIWQQKAHLPSLPKMQKFHAGHMAWRQNAVRKSKSDSRFVAPIVRMPDQFEWLDKTAGTGVFTHFSWWSWRSWRFWWTDRKFYNLVKDGLLSPTVWRLFDVGGRKAWAGAREQIVKDNEFAKMRREKRMSAMNGVAESRKGK